MGIRPGPQKKGRSFIVKKNCGPNYCVSEKRTYINYSTSIMVAGSSVYV